MSPEDPPSLPGKVTSKCLEPYDRVHITSCPSNLSPTCVGQQYVRQGTSKSLLIKHFSTDTHTDLGSESRHYRHWNWNWTEASTTVPLHPSRQNGDERPYCLLQEFKKEISNHTGSSHLLIAVHQAGVPFVQNSGLCSRPTAHCPKSFQGGLALAASATPAKTWQSKLFAVCPEFWYIFKPWKSSTCTVPSDWVGEMWRKEKGMDRDIHSAEDGTSIVQS